MLGGRADSLRSLRERWTVGRRMDGARAESPCRRSRRRNSTRNSSRRNSRRRRSEQSPQQRGVGDLHLLQRAVGRVDARPRVAARLRD